MATCATCVPRLYKGIIDEVISSVRENFLDEGIDEQVLMDLKQQWEAKLAATKATDQSDISHVLTQPNRQGADSSSQAQTQHQNTVTNMALVPVQITVPSQQAGGVAKTITIHVPSTALASGIAGSQLQSILSAPAAAQTFILEASQAAEIIQRQLNTALMQHGVALPPQLMQFNQPTQLDGAVDFPLGPFSDESSAIPLGGDTLPDTFSDAKFFKDSGENELSSSVAHSSFLQQERETTPATEVSRENFQIAGSLPSNSQHKEELVNSSDHKSAMPSFTYDVFSALNTQPTCTCKKSVTVNMPEPSTHSQFEERKSELGATPEGAIALPIPRVKKVKKLRSKRLRDRGLAGEFQAQPVSKSSNFDVRKHQEDNGNEGDDGVKVLVDTAVLDEIVEGRLRAGQVDGACGLGDSSDEISDDDDDDDDDEEEKEEEKKLVEDEEENEEEEHDEYADDPLNSDDDVSDNDAGGDIFETDNVVVCQYDKITRVRNKWKFHLKDGIMNLKSKDYIFTKASGEGEW